jgi:putative DNA primase/helicase
LNAALNVAPAPLPGSLEPGSGARPTSLQAYGLSPIPVYGLREGAVCGCRAGSDCKSPGKHPAGAGWQRAAIDAGGVERWLEQGGNVGLRMGVQPSGVVLVAIDVDGAEGIASFEELIAELGEPLPSLTQTTASGGFHYIAQWPVDEPVPSNGVGQLRSKIDVRGAGAQIVTSPSRHVRDQSGRAYSWACVPARHAADLPFLPEAWRKAMREASKPKKAKALGKATPRAAGLAGIAEGSRNSTLFTRGCSLRSRGANEAKLRTALAHANATCDVPLADDELENIVQSILKYPAGTSATETADAERLAEIHGKTLRYVLDWSRWIAFDGVRWSQSNGEWATQQAAKDMVRHLLADASAEPDDEKRKRILAHANTCESRKARENMISLARWELAVPSENLNRQTEHLLCTPSGLVDLRSGSLTPNDPERLITQRTTTPYDAAALCPTWDRFVLEVCGGRAELAGYLQRAAGYSITGSVRDHVVFFLFGSGANGKGTFVNTLLRALGDYGHVAASTLLVHKPGAQHPTELAALYERRLVVTSEVEKGARWNESQLKTLTGNDRVAARRMREDFWEFEPTHKLWVMANDKRVTRGTDDGIWRRLKLIPFEQSFVGREDTGLAERLLEEAPGILRWAVDGARAWYEGGLQEPELVRQATAAYRDEQDLIGQFFGERVDFGEGLSVGRTTLRESYEQWCKEQGAHPVGPREFAARLREAGCGSTSVREPHRPGPRDGWKGAALRAL